MSDQPPFQPPNQPPYQPPYQPQQPSYAAPTQVPGQNPWAQQPPSSYPQQPYQSGGYGGGPGAPGTPPGGGPKRTPWGLVICALVAGLVIGGGAAAGIVAATTGDPKDSDEYKSLSRDLDEARESLSAGDDPTAEGPDDSPTAETVTPPTDPESSESTPPPPEGGSSGTRDVDGWTLTEPDITEDSLGDFQATMDATNNTGGPEVGYFEITVSKGTTELASLTCINQDGEQVPEGKTVEIQCFTSDDYTDDYDTVDIKAGF